MRAVGKLGTKPKLEALLSHKSAKFDFFSPLKCESWKFYDFWSQRQNVDLHLSCLDLTLEVTPANALHLSAANAKLALAAVCREYFGQHCVFRALISCVLATR